MSQITINKGKLLKGDKVFIDYIKNDGTETEPAECSEKHKTPPHTDLRNAFASLAIHAALNGEFIPISSIEDIEKVKPELIKDFTVSGFTIVGDDEGVIITARKTLKTKKTMGFNTPIISLEEELDDAGNPLKESYPFTDNLAEVLDTCKDEIRLYLNGKHGEKTVKETVKEKDPNQLEMALPE